MVMPVTIRVQAEPFDAAAEAARLTEGRRDVGAVVTFTGLCRDEGGTLAVLELEHYPGMAQEELTALAQQAAVRWPLQGLHSDPPLWQDRARRRYRAGGDSIRPPPCRF